MTSPGPLFKPDYARRIDRYIDYFGGPGPEPALRDTAPLSSTVAGPGPGSWLSPAHPLDPGRLTGKQEEEVP